MGKGERRGSRPRDPVLDHPSVMWPQLSQSSRAAHGLGTPLIPLRSCSPVHSSRLEQAVPPRPEGIPKELGSSVKRMTAAFSQHHVEFSRGQQARNRDAGLAAAWGSVHPARPCSLALSRFPGRTGQRPAHQHWPLFCPHLLLIII